MRAWELHRAVSQNAKLRIFYDALRELVVQETSCIEYKFGWRVFEFDLVENQCVYSHGKLAKITGLSRVKCRRLLQELIDLGAVERTVYPDKGKLSVLDIDCSDIDYLNKI